jgi:4-hydroxy-3-polyprenylbenzoate decarboxylase
MEAAAITRRSYELRSPAPLFTRIAGAPGFRILGAPAGVSAIERAPYARLALSLGLPAECTARDIIAKLVATRDAPPVPPVLVETGPCKENILVGDAATLDIFPAPLVHEQDGGRYLNTWGTLIVKAPDGSWTNWSIARMMKIDGKRMTGRIAPGQHIGHVRKLWSELGQPMPYALVQGPEPAVSVVSGLPLADGVEESGFVGALFGEPVELVKAHTVDLEVPATAEIVIEGHISLENDAAEGPFGEYAGYQALDTFFMPTCTVEAITHRTGAIWPLVAEGRPADEYHTVTGVGSAAECLLILRAAGIPVTMVWSPLEAACHWLVVTVPADWRTALPGVTSEELARLIGEKAFFSKPGFIYPKLFVFDDDIDPSDPAELTWAIATRVHPTGRRAVFEESPIMWMAMCYSPPEQRSMTGPRVVYDCLQPAPGEGRFAQSSFAQSYPEELRRRVIENWQ